ncbi:MAG: hypothetical protein Kow0020_11560 [Wenzhouxiangellaceae bacterium]
MDTSRWSAFEDTEQFFYAGDQLKKLWPRLHCGDCEPWPEDERLVEAWRHFHAGDFASAVTMAEEIGPSAHVVAAKASGIYADYLEEDDQVKLEIFESGARRAEQAIARFPDDPNAHYFHAYHLGRYSQCISIAKALAQGLAGKIRESLEHALKLAPEHAEAHTAMGLYHAEIIGKMGKLVGSMTYGASAERAVWHFEEAIRLCNAPIAWIEYGNGLYLLHGDRKIEESNEAYRKAAEMTPLDAMQALDIAYARNSISD